jgi:hypothetical protein
MWNEAVVAYFNVPLWYLSGWIKEIIISVPLKIGTCHLPNTAQKYYRMGQRARSEDRELTFIALRTADLSVYFYSSNFCGVRERDLCQQHTKCRCNVKSEARSDMSSMKLTNGMAVLLSSVDRARVGVGVGDRQEIF